MKIFQIDRHAHFFMICTITYGYKHLTRQEYSNEPSMTLAKAGYHYSSLARNLVVLEVALLGRHFDFLNRSSAHPIIL